MSALSLIVVWSALVRGAVSAFWSLADCVCFVQLATLVSSSFYQQHEGLLASLAPSLIPLAGIVLVAIGVFRSSPSQT